MLFCLSTLAVSAQFMAHQQRLGLCVYSSCCLMMADWHSFKSLGHLNGHQHVFLMIFGFDRLKASTSGAESSKRTQLAESCRHFICNYLRFICKFLRKLYCTLLNTYVFCHYAQKTCSDDKKHLHEPIVSQVSQILSNWKFVYMHKTV